jgi:TonB-dependent starch-binding outer membrane protein SusC
MLRARSFVLGAVLVGLAGCGPSSIPPAANYATVTGTVVDGASGKPIPNAVVTVDVAIASKPTDASGAFRVTGVPNGDFSYAAAAPGYVSAAGNDRVDAGATRTLVISLKKQS